MFSLNEELIKRLILETLPSFQNVEQINLNLGFGYIYYSLVRTLRPKNVVVIGSKAGFTPVVFGIAVKDNGGYGVGKIECYNTSNIDNDSLGQVYFIDPSYSIDRNDNNHWYGIGSWDNPESVSSLWDSYGLMNIVKHYKMTSEEFAKSKFCPEAIDMIYIDGDHSYDGIMLDFNIFHDKINRNGIILSHDVDPQLPTMLPNSGGFEAFSDLPSSKYEKFRLPIFPGLALIRKKC